MTTPTDSGGEEYVAIVDLTSRRDARTGRPRGDESDSQLDREQKAAGEYYYEP